MIVEKPMCDYCMYDVVFVSYLKKIYDLNAMKTKSMRYYYICGRREAYVRLKHV